MSRLLFLFILSCLSGSAMAQDSLRVLFVGNSYTYFWNLPQTVSTMAENRGVTIVARKSTAGGSTWKQHWKGEKELKSRKIIAQGNWDVVVLQNHSMSTINNPGDFADYGEKFIDLVRESGAIPILYMTWAREFNPLMQKAISEGYKTLGKEHQVYVAPVGEVWAKARTLRPDIRLFDPDSSHPSTIGTYLTACVFFTVLTGEKSNGLPERISTIDKNGEELFYSMMSKEDATFMQELTDSFELERYNAK